MSILLAGGGVFFCRKLDFSCNDLFHTDCNAGAVFDHLCIYNVFLYRKNPGAASWFETGLGFFLYLTSLREFLRAYPVFRLERPVEAGVIPEAAGVAGIGG